MKLTDEGKLQDHLTQLEQIFVDFAGINDPVVPHEKNAILLRSLPESFSMIPLTAEANQMDYDSICALLQSEVERRKITGRKVDGKVTPAARNAKEDGNNRGTSAGRTNLECWYCGKLGHKQQDCRQRIHDSRVRKPFHHGGRGGRGGRGRHGNRGGRSNYHTNRNDWQNANGNRHRNRQPFNRNGNQRYTRNNENNGHHGNNKYNQSNEQDFSMNQPRGFLAKFR